MEKQQDIMCHSKDSLISRTTKFRQFQLAIFVSFAPFHLPYVKAGHVACQNFTLTGPLTLRSHFKLSRAMKIIVFGLNICFQSGLTTNCVRNYPIKNATRIIIWNSNTILCTNLQTLYTGGLECLLCRSCFLL